jgi:opacity protein-like surface antigen
MLMPDYGTLEATAFHAAVGYGYPLTRRLGIFGRVGYAFWDVDEDEVFDGIPESHSASGSDLLYAAGLNVGLSRRWVLDVEWTRYQDVGEVGETGQGDIDAVTATVLYRFGR